MMFQDILFAMRCEHSRPQPVPAVLLQVMLPEHPGKECHAFNFNPRISGTKQKYESGIKAKYEHKRQGETLLSGVHPNPSALWTESQHMNGFSPTHRRDG